MIESVSDTPKTRKDKKDEKIHLYLSATNMYICEVLFILHRVNDYPSYSFDNYVLSLYIPV